MITIDIKTMLIYLVLIAVAVLVIYLIVLVKNLVTTVKNTNKVLEDTAVVSGILAEKAKAADGLADDVIEALGSFTKAVKGEENLIAALSNIAKTIGMAVSFVRKKDDEPARERETGKKK